MITLTEHAKAVKLTITHDGSKGGTYGAAFLFLQIALISLYKPLRNASAFLTTSWIKRIENFTYLLTLPLHLVIAGGIKEKCHLLAGRMAMIFRFKHDKNTTP